MVDLEAFERAIPFLDGLHPPCVADVKSIIAELRELRALKARVEAAPQVEILRHDSAHFVCGVPCGMDLDAKRVRLVPESGEQGDEKGRG